MGVLDSLMPEKKAKKEKSDKTNVKKTFKGEVKKFGKQIEAEAVKNVTKSIAALRAGKMSQKEAISMYQSWSK